MQREELTYYLEGLFQASRFKDYCPNGLQVEGKAEIQRIVFGVTANQALVDAAISLKADALIVHHGYFWRGEDPRIIGIKHRRLASLLRADINLYGYHLPLDWHPELGNNAQLAALLGWEAEGRFGEQDIGWYGKPLDLEPLTLAGLEQRLAITLQRPPLVIGVAEQPIRRLAWCSGGAQSYFEAAIALGVDAFITGEISEPMVHLARESGVAYLACGHHATERFGVQALSAHLQTKFNLDCQFVDIASPV